MSLLWVIVIVWVVSVIFYQAGRNDGQRQLPYGTVVYEPDPPAGESFEEWRERWMRSWRYRYFWRPVLAAMTWLRGPDWWRHDKR